ncbi:LOW QUALITY PROTEIN: up-regulator of cell proliferation-like [Boleophthalmus pectinirostris]|uniref:LOW QUALITY PROTEIN: up-regulator of cell proliferation-like n=1 Tax=Boleophthalmus pectinirostris TaxID=150288 RepID=UPI00242B796E|nr:LOW QUALITY PROTEIN: up-regulator of cell proliferation-like [Boleophthalmus pectinirostris]
MEDDEVHLYTAEGKESVTKEEPVTSSPKGSKLERFLEDVKLEHYYKEKLSMSTILQIDSKAITDKPIKSKTDVVWYFLKKLMMANVTARNMDYASVSDLDSVKSNTESDFDDLFASENLDMLNPLDIITALFLCSDGFVQQELSLKMSMCQFAVPLLLPNCDTNQCTLMLWALRDIVKKYRPKSLVESKGFREERIVHSEIPMISFVRLGECSLSKSEILNKLLSNSEQYHDTFVHHDMQCGDCPKIISNGLAEITWYLPCGNKNIDIFDEPVAIVNLHGDIACFETQYALLCQVSSAVFVFFDNCNLDYTLLRKTNPKDKIYLVVDQKNRHFNLENLKIVARELGLNRNRITAKKNTKNNAAFIKDLRESLTNVIENTTTKMPIEQMTDIALNLGIHVDECKTECQKAKDKANALTGNISDIVQFKETQLPLQRQTWKDLTSLEKEECRLRKVGTQSIEHYKGTLQKQKEELRKKQNSHDMSKAMTCFIEAISSPGIERSFFLKWLRINLDNLSHDKLSDLREQYKRKCNDSENKEEIKEIDEQLSNSSLGTEHFFREMGQIYEASVSLPENDSSHKQLQHLPRLCAQLLLDGFPLELVDGDVSNIPLRWVSDVLAQLHDLVSPNNKILLVTVLGVQSTGKSTLLNTMFGVQFAVSSGRCTRGAFMLLIRISEDLKASLKCDFLVIIDTEGLKSPELAQLDESHEHDNELATLLVGLSDITIINIAMENSTEMKDILQIVVHAFLRMKEVGKKPKCQFVHQNVSDVSAHDKNLRDRKLLLQQLNEMTQAAAKMERKEKYKSFTDVMDYDPDTGNWYIPGLWNGNPPMAPVNAGYSEAVYELKKNVMHILENHATPANDIVQFHEWIRSLWEAVKHENFIFSFRNSLVADAYMRLCTEYNKWEWDLKIDMYSWVTTAQTKIKNFGTIADKDKAQYSDVKQLQTYLKSEASTKLSSWETTLIDKLSEYFKQKEGHVYLVERYKQEFENSIKSLRKALEHSVSNELNAAADMKQGQAELDRVKEKYTKELEGRVCKLIENCRERHADMTEEELDTEFDQMWNKTLKELIDYKQHPLNIFDNVDFHLRQNLKDKGSLACEELNKRRLTDCGHGPYKCTAEGWFKHFVHQISKYVKHEDSVMRAQMLADRIIAACQHCVNQKVEKKNNYRETYIQEILTIIDKNLNNEEMIKDMGFQVSLKQHICAGAAREFQKMHDNFLKENDPYQRLVQNKKNFHTAFIDVFYERDQCKKKADEFAHKCLGPAVKDFISSSLGPAIVSEMHTYKEFSTRMVFQYTVLLDLLQKDSFSDFLCYIRSYENYVKQWILDQILKHLSEQKDMLQSESQLLESGLTSIKKSLMKAKSASSATVKEFVEIICNELGDKLVISRDAFDTFMILNNANLEQFATWLEESVNEMAKSLRQKLQTESPEEKLQSLGMKPQDELFDKLIGCGKQCPFCSATCEAGGRDHSEHWPTLHLPQAFGKYRWHQSQKLNIDICSSLVLTNGSFQCEETKWQWHPYKRYKEIFPAWNIVPDISLKASNYWKYVLAKFNFQFAREYKALPANIPQAWKWIPKKQVEESLKESFGIK